MSYVVYTSHLAIQERTRTPLGKLASWLSSRAAGTFLHGTLSFLFHGSLVARVATAITVSLALSAVIDFSFTFFLPSAVGLATCATIGLLAGFAAQGSGGAVIGFVWGWLIGGAVDALAADLISDPAMRIGSKVLAWLVTALLGWVIGLFTAWCFEKLTANHRRLRKIIERIAITLVLACLVLVSFKLLAWLLTTYPVVSTISGFLKSNWRWIVVIACWLLALGMPIYWVLDWFGDWSQSMMKWHNHMRLDYSSLEDMDYPFLSGPSFIGHVLSDHKVGLIVWIIWVVASFIATRSIF